AIRRLLRRSLEKDRKQRLPDIAVARLEIDEALTLPAVDADATNRDAQPARWQRVLPGVMFASALVGLALVVALWAPWREAAPPALLRLEVGLGADVSLAFNPTALGPSSV